MPIKRRPWPQKRREKQAENCRKTCPSANSTGPKTTAGKAICAQNARAHGLRSHEVLQLKKLLKQQKAFIDALESPIL